MKNNLQKGSISVLASIAIMMGMFAYMALATLWQVNTTYIMAQAELDDKLRTTVLESICYPEIIKEERVLFYGVGNIQSYRYASNFAINEELYGWYDLNNHTWVNPTGSGYKITLFNPHGDLYPWADYSARDSSGNNINGYRSINQCSNDTALTWLLNENFQKALQNIYGGSIDNHDIIWSSSDAIPDGAKTKFNFIGAYLDARMMSVANKTTLYTQATATVEIDTSAFGVEDELARVFAKMVYNAKIYYSVGLDRYVHPLMEKEAFINNYTASDSVTIPIYCSYAYDFN